MADETKTLQFICRNCGNKGFSPWTGKPCECRYGKALEQMAAAELGNAPFPVDAFKTADDAVAAQVAIEQALEPAQTSEPRALIWYFAAAMERKLAAREYRGTWRHYPSGTVALWEMALAEVNEFRDALNALARLADSLSEFDADRAWKLDEARQALLNEAADVANFLAMICDVVGALPPTDERGR